MKNCTYCYFDDIININDLNLIDEKSYENILIHKFAYDNSIPYGAKLQPIIFDKVDDYIILLF